MVEIPLTFAAAKFVQSGLFAQIHDLVWISRINGGYESGDR